MPSAPYSYLDVAILDDVRDRFAVGDALIVLTRELDEVIWANGPGAQLLGHRDIEGAIGQQSPFGAAAQRQIMATRGYPDIGRDRVVLVRLSTGMSSQLVGFLATAIVLPDGEPALLMAQPANHPRSRSAADIGERAIAGFGQPGEHVALLDGSGAAIATTAGFADLGVAAATLATLAAAVSGESDRLVKRMVAGTAGVFPAGIARLVDDPAVNLLIVVDEASFEAARPAASPAGPDMRAPLPPREATAGEADTETDKNATTDIPAASTEASPPDVDPPQLSDSEDAEPDVTYDGARTGEFDDGKDQAEEVTGMDKPVDPNSPVEEDHYYQSIRESDGEISDEDAASATLPLPPQDQTPPLYDSAHDNWYFSHRADHGRLIDGDIDRHAPPVRFVWRTDADGRFSAMSPELGALVGETAAVVGQAFGTVAATYGFDRSSEIAALLDRRDTWSGRTVPWPVAGTTLKVPVDLAALPIYGRDRTFEGFRGFGVARPADAFDDPEAALADGVSDQEADDPFLGEVPALASSAAMPLPDKVIRLEERRNAVERRLSPVERVAFEEIGERLKRDDGTASDADAVPAGPATSDTIAPGDASVTAVLTTDEAAATTSLDEPASGADETGEHHFEAADPDEADEPPDPSDLVDLAVLDGEFAEQLLAADGDAPSGGEASAVHPSDEFGGLSAEEFLTLAREASAVEAQAPVATIMDDGRLPPPEPMEVEQEVPPAQGVVEPAPALAGPLPREAGSATVMTSGFLPSAYAPGWGKAIAPRLHLPEARTPTPRAEPPAQAPLPIESADVEYAVEPDLASVARSTVPDTSILARLPVPVLIHSGDTLHYANPAFLELTAFASLDELHDAGGLDRLFVESYRAEQMPDSADRELRMLTNDGLEFPIDAILRSVPWAGGHALMLVVRRTGGDEDAQEDERDNFDPAAIGNLKARLAEMRTIVDTATDGVVLISPDATIRSISRPAEALFGFDSDEVRGKAFVSLFAVESQRVALDYLNGIADGGVASLMNDGREVIGREAQGRFIPLFMTIGRLPDDNGYCAVVRDITQWKRAEEELTQARSAAERSSSQKTEFLARISHEIRTPLNAIIGFSELMLDGKFGPVGNDRYRDYLRDINRSGSHVLDLVNDLLDITKIEAGQQEMSYVPVSLNETLGETVAMMQPQANRERVIIRSSFASRLPEVVADLRSIRQIALNILSNAVRYTQAGGQVIVSTAQEPNGEVVMRVRDTGIGMSPAEIEHALKPFKQINALKRTRGDGTGLGLPLTKAMVEANRARFVITSVPGEGTLVEIAFPASRVLAEPDKNADKSA